MKARRNAGKAIQDTATIEEVLYATEAHLKALRGMRQKGRLDPDLDDVIEGLGISADKLRLALMDARRFAAPQRIVVSVADGRVKGVMSSVPGMRAELFDFDGRIAELSDGEFAGEPNSGRAAERADREFAEATKGMADALVATAGRKGR